MSPAAPPIWAPSGRDPSAPALDDGTRSVSWSQLEDHTNAIGNGLESLGLSPADHVALVATNRVEFLEVLLGCMRAGMVVTPVKAGWTASEISYLMADAGTRLVVTDRDAARAAAADAGVTALELDDRFADWVAGQSTSPLPLARRGWRLPYTSGTTGRPRGVVYSTSGSASFTESWAASTAMADRLRLPPWGWHLVASRLFHGAPLNFALSALASGASLRILARWAPEIALEQLATEVTSTCMVPTMFRQMLALGSVVCPGARPTDLRTVVHGGEPCPVALKRQMIHWWGPIFLEYFGFTEGGMTLATTDDWLERPGTVGRPEGQEVVIRGPDGERLPPGQEGLIYFSPPEGGGRDFSYHNDPGKTADAHDADGGFTAGDLGWVDEDGYLYVSGRSSEVIVSAGVNIYPAEVESVLLAVPGVADACVVGGPDELTGERVLAYVVPAGRRDDEMLRSRLAEAARKELASYQQPRGITLCETIPRDETGKLVRSALRRQVWGEESAFAARSTGTVSEAHQRGASPRRDPHQ